MLKFIDMTLCNVEMAQFNRAILKVRTNLVIRLCDVKH